MASFLKIVLRERDGSGNKWLRRNVIRFAPASHAGDFSFEEIFPKGQHEYYRWLD